ncbi:MAG: efflux RND transporter periplasmic adaptor subunit [Alphaproteobacteria bacterium]
MLKKIFWGIVIILLIVAGYYAWRVTRPQIVVQAQIPVVDAVRLGKTEIYPEASFVAKIESQDKVALRARVSGFLQERLFQEGDIVKKDQPLFIIEQVNYESSVKSAEANYAKAVAAAKNATSQYDRTKKLYQTKDVSKAKLDEVEAAYDSAKATVNQMQALLDVAKQDLEYTVIRAPMDGKVGESAFSVGELIGPSSGVLAQVVKIDPIDAVFSVSENQLMQLRHQFPDTEEVEAHFFFSDEREYPVIGKVDFVDVVLDEQMNTLKMKADFANPEGKLISGQYGRILLKGTKSTNVLTIPQRAVQHDKSAAFVYVVTADNKIEKRTITTGMDLPGFLYEVVSGLKAGEVVVTDGFQKIAPNASVKANLAD